MDTHVRILILVQVFFGFVFESSQLHQERTQMEVQ